MTRKRLAFGGATLALAVVALSGAVGAGAGTNGQVTTTFSVLNDIGTLVAGTPTPGKNIGYQFTLQNVGTSTINHFVLNAYISSDLAGTNKVGAVVYKTVDNTSVSCTGSQALKCTDSQLIAGEKFTLTVIFSTDPSANANDPVYPQFSGTYSPESQNTSNNRNTTTKSFTIDTAGNVRFYADPVSNTFAQSLSLVNDGLGVGAGSFVASVKMPPGFLNSNNYVGVTLREQSNVAAPTACATFGTCLPYEITTTIPTATTVDQIGNPFGTTAGYTWSFTIPVPNGFKGTGVFHIDDSNGSPTSLPLCSAPGALTTAPGICISSIVLDKHTNPNTVTYSGVGAANGHTWGF